MSLHIDELTVGKVRGWTMHPTTAAVAEKYVALCRQRRFDEAMEQLFSREHVHVESVDMNGPVETRGIEAMRDSSRDFSSTHHVHRLEIEGPLVAADGQIIRSEAYYNTQLLRP